MRRLREVLQQRPAVLLKASEERGDLEVGVWPAAHGEVVGARDDVDAVWEIALPSHILLEGGRGGAAAIDLAIEHHDDEERLARVEGGR